MYCPKCGTEIPDTSTFCLSCGNKIINPEQILRSHKTSNILFISTIVVVILGIAALYFLLKNQEPENAELAANRTSPTPTVSLSPSPSPTASPSPSPTPITDIRTVNFRKMSFPLGSARVSGGDSNMQVIYGDLDNDGMDEAVVNLTYTLGDGKPFSKGFVYAVKEGKLQRVAEVEGGDKANGGILKTQIADGKLEVERCQLDQSDNSLNIETTTYQLTDNRLTQVDKKKRKTDACL